MSATEARAALPELLDRVEAGDEVTITRHGRAVAVVVRPDALRVRRAGEAHAVHLATAVGAGADRFVTNNQRDFPRTIAEIDVVYPADLVPLARSIAAGLPRTDM